MWFWESTFLHWPESIIAIKQSKVDICIELNSLDTSGLEMKATVFKQLIRCEEPIDHQKMIKRRQIPGSRWSLCSAFCPEPLMILLSSLLFISVLLKAWFCLKSFTSVSFLLSGSSFFSYHVHYLVQIIHFTSRTFLC